MGQIGCTETSLTINLRCVGTQKSTDLIDNSSHNISVNTVEVNSIYRMQNFLQTAVRFVSTQICVGSL